MSTQVANGNVQQSEAIAEKSVTTADQKPADQSSDSTTKDQQQVTTTTEETPKKQELRGQYLEVNGINLYYEKVGTGPIKVLLLPGLCGTARSDFAEQLDALDKNRFTMVSWDPPGYGHSRPPERNYVYTVYQDDAKLAAALMEKLGYENYCVLGWSDGGKTALNLAALYPSVVDKLVVWGVVCYRQPHADKAFYLTKDFNFWDADMLRRFTAVYGEQQFKRLWVKMVDDCFRAGIGRDAPIIPETLLKKIHCPCLILHGDSDPMVGKDQPQYLSTHLIDSQLHRFPRASHNCHQTCAKQFNQIVQLFLVE